MYMKVWLCGAVVERPPEIGGSRVRSTALCCFVLEQDTLHTLRSTGSTQEANESDQRKPTVVSQIHNHCKINKFKCIHKMSVRGAGVGST